MMVDIENVTDSEFANIEKLILEFPIPLLGIENSKILDAIDAYLPYSIGMEFECFQKGTYSENSFRNIPNIMDVQVDTNEQRYRIPKGLKGLVCLYHICTQLKLNSDLDLRSSNHYHFDFTDIIYIDNNNEIIHKGIVCDENKDYILNELIKWETAKNLTQKENWIRFFNSPLCTLEIRIGEPTFEYEIIVKRLIDGCRISKYLKDWIKDNEQIEQLNRLNKELLKIEKEKLENNNSVYPDKINDENNQIIKKRVFKI